MSDVTADLIEKTWHDPAPQPWTWDERERCPRDATRVSREWAEAFLKEWARPYFGEDGMDAVACVQRAAEFANACVTTPAVTEEPTDG